MESGSQKLLFSQQSIPTNLRSQLSLQYIAAALVHLSNPHWKDACKRDMTTAGLRGRRNEQRRMGERWSAVRVTPVDGTSLEQVAIKVLRNVVGGGKGAKFPEKSVTTWMVSKKKKKNHFSSVH